MSRFTAQILNGPDDTWTHALARACVRPLLGPWVRPNHFTTLRLLTGLAACAFLALGTPRGVLWFGVFWLLSCFLDRVDGELARIGRMMSRGGHLYDMYVDQAVNALVFLAMGIGLRHSALDGWAIPLGVDASACMLLCGWLSEMFEQEQDGERIWGSAFLGFHPDDALYLLPVFAWAGWLLPVLVAAAAATSLILLVILVRLARQRARRAG